MTTLEIIKLKETNAVTLTAEELKEKVFFEVSGEEIKAQTGSVILEVSIIEGEINIGDHAVFLFDSTHTGDILSSMKQETGNYIIDLKLEPVYLEGLELSIQHFIEPGKIIISLNDLEKSSLLKIDNQKQFLSRLLKHFLPKRHDSILDLAIKSYLCAPNEYDNENKSHFLGKPKHEVNSLFHLSTLLSTEIEELHTIENLSFYLDVNNSDTGLPESDRDFKVVSNIGSSMNIDDSQYDKANNFTTQQFFDLPSPEHSTMFSLNLSYDEIDLYIEMKSFYLEHIIDKSFEQKVGGNKIFGYPDSIQNCVSYEAERINNSREYNDEIYNEAKNWMMLLQISPDCKMFDFFNQFGYNTIYFMIRKEDFKENNFQNCQVVIQNT